MEATGWGQFFEGIRVEDQVSLVVRTTDMLEIAVEGIARIEPNVILFRGRVAGTADARRVFIIPYDRLSSVYVNRPVALEEVDLFSTEITPEQKRKLAEEYEATLAAAQEAIRQMGAGIGDKGNTAELKAQLDELKRMNDRQTPVMKTGATPVTKNTDDGSLNRPVDEKLARPEDKAISAPAPNVITVGPTAAAITAAPESSTRLALPPVPERRITGRFTLPDRPKADPNASQAENGPAPTNEST
ncbi:hypothetical protein K2X85_11020 [bacterium]|nr:hypothetical protein [bacterium]